MSIFTELLALWTKVSLLLFFLEKKAKSSSLLSKLVKKKDVSAHLKYGSAIRPFHHSLTLWVLLLTKKVVDTSLLQGIFHNWHQQFSNHSYSGANLKVYGYCFMKQKCQVQMVIAQYKNAGKPLISRGINTIHQHFQMRYVNLI